jgi:predicted enzyme related to lactoylglutathione lyase
VVRDGLGLDVQAELSHAGGVSTTCLRTPIREAAPELPGSVPYVHVPDAPVAFEKALREGAEAMMAPERVMEGVTIAVVRAPGGVPIGFAGP